MFEGAPNSSAAGSDTECFRWFEKSISSPPLPFDIQFYDSIGLKPWRSLRELYCEGNMSLVHDRALIRALHHRTLSALFDTYKTISKTGPIHRGASSWDNLNG